MPLFTETHNLDHLHHPSNPVPTIRSLENVDAQGSDQSDSLSMLQLDMNASNNDKLAWLRSELIGGDIEFDTPFGKRILTYADHTASGRALHYIESFILRNVLPFYGMFIKYFVIDNAYCFCCLPYIFQLLKDIMILC